MSLSSELTAIQSAVESGDFATARSLSDAYVAANPSVYADYDEDIHLGVKRVEVFRDAGLETSQWQAEAWLLHTFDPQNIGGIAAATIRVVPS